MITAQIVLPDGVWQPVDVALIGVDGDPATTLRHGAVCEHEPLKLFMEGLTQHASTRSAASNDIVISWSPPLVDVDVTRCLWNAGRLPPCAPLHDDPMKYSDVVDCVLRVDAGTEIVREGGPGLPVVWTEVDGHEEAEYRLHDIVDMFSDRRWLEFFDGGAGRFLVWIRYGCSNDLLRFTGFAVAVFFDENNLDGHRKISRNDDIFADFLLLSASVAITTFTVDECSIISSCSSMSWQARSRRRVGLRQVMDSMSIVDEWQDLIEGEWLLSATSCRR
jgi:hypothetical protein